MYEKATQAVACEKANFIESMNILLENAEMAIFNDESNKVCFFLLDVHDYSHHIIQPIIANHSAFVI